MWVWGKLKTWSHEVVKFVYHYIVVVMLIFLPISADTVSTTILFIIKFKFVSIIWWISNNLRNGSITFMDWLVWGCLCKENLIRLRNPQIGQPYNGLHTHKVIWLYWKYWHFVSMFGFCLHKFWSYLWFASRMATGSSQKYMHLTTLSQRHTSLYDGSIIKINWRIVVLGLHIPVNQQHICTMVAMMKIHLQFCY